MTELTILTTPSTLFTHPNNVNETKQNSLFNTAFKNFLNLIILC